MSEESQLEFKKVEVKTVKNQVVIIAPHIDDELIGCRNVLTKYKDQGTVVVYTSKMDPERQKEALKAKEHFEISVQFFQASIPSHLLDPSNRFFFPDPIYERHPYHRHWGNIGEQLFRGGYDVTFYSVNMEAPYIFEVKDPEQKLEDLNTIYPSQSDLWRYQFKYYLFEGYCQFHKYE